MRIPGLKSLKLSARWLRSRLIRGALILGYHRIAEPVSGASPLCVTPQHLSEQLAVLSRVGQVISLQELISSLREKRMPKRAVVLTFDDGYADVLYHAKPLLERYQTPATVFVTTGSLGCEFWWDRLERVYLSSSRLPEQRSVQIRDGSHEWVLGDLGQGPHSGFRQHAVQSIFRSLSLLPDVEREEAMARLGAWSGTVPDERPFPRALTSDELIELATGDLIGVGAHTVTHPVLAGLPIEMQRAEIQGSKVYLQKILGQPVTSFSYPNGSWSRRTQAIVRESGFGCGCGSYNDVVWRGSDRFHLPRFWIPDWDGEAFVRWLRLWLAA